MDPKELERLKKELEILNREIGPRNRELGRKAFAETVAHANKQLEINRRIREKHLQGHEIEPHRSVYDCLVAECYELAEQQLKEGK